MEQQLDRIERKVDTLSSILMGNGSAGLCEQVRILEAIHEQQISRTTWAVRSVVIAALSVVAKLAYDLYQHLQV